MSFVPNFIRNLLTSKGQQEQDQRVIPDDVLKKINYSETLMKLSNTPYKNRQKVKDDLIKLYLDFPYVDNTKISLLLKGYDDLNPDYEILLAEFPSNLQKNFKHIKVKVTKNEKERIVNIKLFFEFDYPESAPIMRIKNVKDEQVRVNKYYDQYTQGDIYLDRLIKSMGTWKQNNDIVKIIVQKKIFFFWQTQVFAELHALIENQFPFYSCKDIEVLEFIQSTNVYLPWNDEEYQNNKDNEERTQQVQNQIQRAIKNTQITNAPLIGNSPIIDINTGLDVTFLKTFEKNVKDKVSIGCQGLVNDIKQQKKKLLGTLSLLEQQSRIFKEQGNLIQELDITIPEIINADIQNQNIIQANQNKLKEDEDMDKFFGFIPAQTIDVYTEIQASMDTIQFISKNFQQNKISLEATLQVDYYQ